MSDNTVHDRPTLTVALGTSRPNPAASVADATGFSGSDAPEDPAPTKRPTPGKRIE